ncbi:MAG TPA: sigma 54-interacting transcriptional regulator [Polyangiaceae bacterium]
MSDTLRSLEESLASSQRASGFALTVVHSPDAAVVGRRVALPLNGTLFVGRQAEGGLGISDDQMSKVHLLIVATGTRLECADSGSTNGTFVNGAAIKSAALAPGAVIRAGNTLFTVSAGNPTETLRASVARVAPSQFSVLLSGETGTGKDVVARSIHEQSGRSGPFVPLNCATLQPDLAAAELFGHVRGAFSGADGQRLGMFRAAEGGTLFLDEIGDLPIGLQPALLRALEGHKVRPIGAEHEVPVDVRVISATHIHLEEAVGAKRFRADLLARLSPVVLRLPPLRERRADILSLASEFVPGVRFSPNAAEALLLSDWPRNVRELRGVVEVAALVAKDRSRIRSKDLAERLPQAVALVRERSGPSRIQSDAPQGPHPLAERREELRTLFEKHQGNVSKVAQELGKPRAQVYRWLAALGIDPKQFR